MCQQLKNFCNSLNQYFPNYLQNHAQIKDPFKVQDTPMNFNETKYKHFTMISDSTLQLSFRKPLLQVSM